jgi:phage-related protein
MKESPQQRWRWYRTASGNAPVKDFLDDISAVDRAAIVAAMNEIRREGLGAARRLDDDLWEVRAVGVKAHYRLIFAHEGRRVLLALDAFDKDSQRTPLRILRRARQRLADWHQRAAESGSAL